MPRTDAGARRVRDDDLEDDEDLFGDGSAAGDGDLEDDEDLFGEPPPQATDDLPPSQPPAARELAERSLKSPTPPPQPREEPAWYEELTAGAQGLSNNLAGKVHGALSWAGDGLREHPVYDRSISGLGDAIDAEEAPYQHAARAHPIAHGAGQLAQGIALGVAAGPARATQMGLSATQGALSEYADSESLKRAGAMGVVGGAAGLAGTYVADGVARGAGAVRGLLRGAGDDLLAPAARPSAPLRGEFEPTTLPRPSAPAGPPLAEPTMPGGPPPLPPARPPQGSPTLPAPGGPPPPPPQRAPFDVAQSELLPPHPPAPAPRPANPPPPMRSDDALEMELLSPEPPAPLPVPGGQAGGTWPPDYAPPPYSRANSGRFERPPLAASTLEYVPSEARPRMGRPDLSHPELANAAERDALLDEFLSPSDAALRTGAPIPEPRAPAPLSIAEPPPAPRRLLGELDQTPSARPPAMPEEAGYALGGELEPVGAPRMRGMLGDPSPVPKPLPASDPTDKSTVLDAMAKARGIPGMRGLMRGGRLAGHALDYGTDALAYAHNAPASPVGRALTKSAWELGAPALLGAQVNAQAPEDAPSRAAEDAPAYASSATLNYALSEAMSTDVGKLGLGQRDHEALTSALVRGDDSAIAALDYRLRQKYPAYAYQVERQLRDLNDEGD